MSERFCRANDVTALPKCELHVHLNGAASVKLIERIIRDENVVIPEGLEIPRDLLCANATSLIEYIQPWRLLRLIPSIKSNHRMMIDSAFDGFKENNVAYVEIRNSVSYISDIQNISIQEALQNLITCVDDSSAKRSIQSAIIMTVSRSPQSFDDLTNLLRAFEDLGRPSKVVAIDLAGDESVPVAPELARLFKDAKSKFGLKITIHAGETGCVRNIISAVDDFDADRIGHGVAAIKDQKVMDYLREKDICLELCPVSNRLTNAFDQDYNHPILQLTSNGVPVSICSDNPGLHECGLNTDYALALESGVGFDFLAGQYEVSSRYAFSKVIAK